MQAGRDDTPAGPQLSPAERWLREFNPNKPFVYLAGPMRKDPVKGLHQAIEVAEKLIDMGFMPFLPQLCFVWNMISHRDDNAIYRYFLPWDFYWVSRCQALLRLEGESFGADEEIKVARALGIPVFFTVDDLCNAFKSR